VLTQERQRQQQHIYHQRHEHGRDNDKVNLERARLTSADSGYLSAVFEWIEIINNRANDGRPRERASRPNERTISFCLFGVGIVSWRRWLLSRLSLSLSQSCSAAPNWPTSHTTGRAHFRVLLPFASADQNGRPAVGGGAAHYCRAFGVRPSRGRPVPPTWAARLERPARRLF
jgi:hypothetical protein